MTDIDISTEAVKAFCNEDGKGGRRWGYRAAAKLTALAAERDRLMDMFRIDGEQNANHIRGLTERHETRITKYMEAVTELRAERDALKAVIAQLARDAEKFMSGYHPKDGALLRQAIAAAKDAMK